MEQTIQPDLNKDISAIQVPERRALIRGQTIIIYVLGGVIGVLFGIIIHDKKSSGGDKDKLITELKEDKTHLSIELKETKVKLAAKDSMLTTALVRIGVYQQEDIDYKKKVDAEVSQSLKRQDTIFSIFR